MNLRQKHKWNSGDENLVPVMVSKQKKRRFWVHSPHTALPIHSNKLEMDKAIFSSSEELKLYPSPIQMYFRMAVGQFVTG